MDIFTRVGLGRIAAAFDADPRVAQQEDPLAALVANHKGNSEFRWGRLLEHLELGIRCGYLQLTFEDMPPDLLPLAVQPEAQLSSLSESFLNRSRSSSGAPVPAASPQALAAFETYFRIDEFVRSNPSIYEFLSYACGWSKIDVDPIAFASPNTFAEALVLRRVRGIPVGDRVAGGVAYVRACQRLVRLSEGLAELPAIREAVSEVAVWSKSIDANDVLKRWTRWADSWPARSVAGEAEAAHATFQAFIEKARGLLAQESFLFATDTPDLDILTQLGPETEHAHSLPDRIAQMVREALVFQRYDPARAWRAVETLFDLGELDKAALLSVPIVLQRIDDRQFNPGTRLPDLMAHLRGIRGAHAAQQDVRATLESANDEPKSARQDFDFGG